MEESDSSDEAQDIAEDDRVPTFRIIWKASSSSSNVSEATIF